VILVTGANGTTGSEVVRQLAKAKRKVRALVRRREKAAGFHESVEVAIGDLTQPKTLEAAFAGVEATYVVAPNDGADIVALEGAAYAAAKQAGVKKIVKLSARGVDTSLLADSPLAKMHIESERRLRALGIPWTVLRPGPFMTSLIRNWRILESGTLALPTGEGKEPLIDPHDVAAVAVEALVPGRHDGKVYDLSGPELLAYGDVVARLARAVGRPLRFVDMPDSAWRETMIKAGAPEGLVVAAGRWYSAVRNGQMTVALGVETVLGRPGRTLDQWLADGGAAS
jgi:uncharacterized protein YbjT (DUF2867 family)